MGKITKIEQQRNKKRVNVFIDGDFFCGLLTETAVTFGFKVGVVVDENDVLKAVKESEIKSAFAKASDYLASRMHSEFELSKKLAQKGFEKEVVDEAVRRLKDYGYVDDVLFAKEFVRENSKYSRRMLEKKLFERGVDRRLVSNLLNELDNSSETSLCEKYALKYIKSHDKTKEGFNQKLFSSLASKGFEFDTIKKVVGKLNLKNDSDDL